MVNFFRLLWENSAALVIHWCCHNCCPADKVAVAAKSATNVSFVRRATKKWGQIVLKVFVIRRSEYWSLLSKPDWREEKPVFLRRPVCTTVQLCLEGGTSPGSYLARSAAGADPLLCAPVCIHRGVAGGGAVTSRPKSEKSMTRLIFQ